MKYIKLFENKENLDTVIKIMDHFNYKYGYDYTIKDDDELHFNEDINLSGYKFENGIFPYKISSAQDLEMRGCGLISLENFPKMLYGNLNVRNNNIKNMKHFPPDVSFGIEEINISHNPIEDLIGIPVRLMFENKVNYGNLDRDILDKYWDYQMDYIEIEDLRKKIKLSRNTNKNNTVSVKSSLGELLQGIKRSVGVGLWDFKNESKYLQKKKGKLLDREGNKKEFWNEQLISSIKNRIIEDTIEAISNNADVNVRDAVENYTPLIWAVIYNNIDAVKYLILKGADIFLNTIYTKDTVFDFAETFNRKEIIKYLSEYVIRNHPDKINEIIKYIPNDIKRKYPKIFREFNAGLWDLKI